MTDFIDIVSVDTSKDDVATGRSAPPRPAGVLDKYAEYAEDAG